MTIAVRDGRVRILWPERRWVDFDTLIVWAKDAVANGDADGPVEGLESAITILSDTGAVTFASR